MVAASAGFYAVFAFFVAAMVVLVVLSVRFTLRRDRERRAEWRAKTGRD